ncbi:hypothetical protein KC867_01955 [Candidatus Saccharibacteria bacterium]|nr:hypothetical protein [Candidatus Saccharibacteria bacterium]
MKKKDFTRDLESQMPAGHLFLCSEEQTSPILLSQIPHIESIRLGSLVARGELEVCLDEQRGFELADQAGQYIDLCATIRVETRRIGRLILNSLKDDNTSVLLGDNQYGKVKALYGHEPFCRIDEEVYTLFDWGADTKDTPHLRHATMTDHIQLINDFKINDRT